MNKEETKDLIKTQLWNWKYKVKDMAMIIKEAPYDLVVNGIYRVKIVKYKNASELKKEVEGIKGGEWYDVVATVYAGKKIYAGGKQKKPGLTTRHQDVF